ncbi:VRR-NUC domain-containing protein [Psychrobacter sp. 16-MNA-CIBAN-0192]|uniref:VRR-NUC domain-containing protein n=1 Tax=Psychrobacter sp. 16-MNA-CIBAN-0192 TaxID=3140448 RepID=UPI003328E594
MTTRKIHVGTSEDSIQKAILIWAGYIKHNGRSLADYLVHTPNGGGRSLGEGYNFKKMGVKKGYPDLILDIAKGGYHGLRIELKKVKGSRTTPEQLERLDMLNAEGYYAIIAKGFDHAIQIITDYMAGTL